MADIAHTTTLPELRQLSGSSPPGAGAPRFKPATAPKPRPQLRPRLDAEVIELADRVKKLGRRHAAVYARVERLEMQVEAVHPRPPLPVSNAVFHAYHAEIRPTEERLGVARLRNVRRRMMDRLMRWTRRLTDMEPRTLAGLGAKADIVLAVRAEDRFDLFIDNLAESVNRDAVRLAIVTSYPVTDEDPESSGEAAAVYPDPDLLALIANHAPALAAAAESEVALIEARARFDAEEPKRPDALYFRFDDPASMPSGRVPSANGFRMVYTDAEIEELRVGPYPQMLSSGAVDSPEGPGMAFRPDPRRAARKAAILAAHDAWKAERRVVAESTGWKAANAEHARLSREAREIEDAILEAPTQILADVQAKACWIEQQDKVEEWSYFVLYDVIGLDTPATISVEDEAPANDVRAA